MLGTRVFWGEVGIHPRASWGVVSTAAKVAVVYPTAVMSPRTLPRARCSGEYVHTVTGMCVKLALYRDLEAKAQ